MPDPWKPYQPDEVDLTGATTYRETGPVIAGGTWHVLADGRVVHRTVDGNLQPAVHSVEALEDPARFTPVDA
jgi:hypothetical protein